MQVSLHQLRQFSIYIGRTASPKNLVIYIISLVSYFVVYGLIMLFVRNNCEDKKSIGNIILGSLLLGLLIMLGINNILESVPMYAFYGWTILPDWIIVIVILLGSWLTFCKLYSGGMIARSYCCIF